MLNLNLGIEMSRRGTSESNDATKDPRRASQKA
jgi:hypothetical protein